MILLDADKASFSSYILLRTQLLLNFVFYVVPLVIIPEVMDQTHNEGDNASFTCQASSEPVPTISWYFNGSPVDEDNTIKYIISIMSLNTTTISNTLTIMSVESSDVGTYMCRATNVLSSGTSSGILTVNGELTILLCHKGYNM